MLDASDTEDAAPAPLGHSRQRRLNESESGPQIRISVPLEQRVVDIGEHAALLDGGVQDENVERPVGKRRVGKTVRAGRIDQVSPDRASGAAGGLDLAEQVGGRGFVPMIVEGDRRAVGGEAHRDRPADAAARACHKGAAAVEPERLRTSDRHEMPRREMRWTNNPKVLRFTCEPFPIQS